MVDRSVGQNRIHRTSIHRLEGMFSYSKFYFWIFWDYENKRFVNWAELGPKKETLRNTYTVENYFNNHILEFIWYFWGFCCHFYCTGSWNSGESLISECEMMVNQKNWVLFQEALFFFLHFVMRRKFDLLGCFHCTLHVFNVHLGIFGWD